MANRGRASWGQRFLDLGSATPLVVDGVSMEAIYEAYSSSTDDAAVFVDVMGGGAVFHGTVADAEAPRSIIPSEIELEIQMNGEEQRALISSAPALGASGILEFYLDAWIPDLWVATGAQNIFVLSRSFFYGGGPSFLDRPARVFVNNVEQPVVDGAPGPGEFGIDQGANGNLLTAGTAPLAGDRVRLQYYPLLTGGASYDESVSDFNDGTMSITFNEKPGVVAYS